MVSSYRGVGAVGRGQTGQSVEAGEQRAWMADRIDDLLVSEVVSATCAPIIEDRNRLAALRQRLDRISSV